MPKPSIPANAEGLSEIDAEILLLWSGLDSNQKREALAYARRICAEKGVILP
ncbi:hypothetical protein [Brucella pituitosa]|uniref:hypothetical protein n=1 Tax=Brucella pituitosa TaxID=571256 RepID=UPI0013E2E2BE|nr:hypothetical protein [Brucella pituitosa]